MGKELCRVAIVGAVALFVCSSPARASYVIDVVQIGSSVYGFGAGSVNTTGLNFVGTIGSVAYTNPMRPSLVLGASGGRDNYGGVTSGGPIGTAGVENATSGTGALAGIVGAGATVTVPLQYVSGTDLGISTATWTDASFDSLGLTPGSYTYVWSSGTLGVQIGDMGAVPEPCTWAMMMLGFGGTGYVMRRKKKVAARIRFA